jgi:hypothetical protein
MKKISLLILVAGFAIAQGFAQNMTIDGIRKKSLRNTDAITEGSEVKGYYFFYVSDKVDKKTNEYTLRIVDNNLKLIKDVVFTGNKDLQIIESSFNGKDLMFLYYNEKERTLDYQVYGTDGKAKFTYNRELTKKERRYLEATYFEKSNDEGQYKGLYPVENKGFISNMPSREDKDFTYQLDFFSSDKKKQWTYNPTEGAKVFLGDYLGEINDVIYVEEIRLKNRMDGTPDSYVVGFDMLTGKKLFEKETIGKNKLYPVATSIINGKSYIYGEYFGENENIMKGKSNGFGFWEIDGTGKILSEKYLSWADDFGKFMEVDKDGKIDKFGFLYLHKMMQTADGKVFAIGEGFKRVASGFGIAATLLSGGRADVSLTKFKTTNMMVIEFDANLKIKAANVYEKSSNNFELPQGYDFVSLPIIAKMLKYTYGGFDYEYTQANVANTSFSTYYRDYVKSKEYKGATYNAVTYKDGKLKLNTLELKTTASEQRILPAKQGHVLVLEYFRKRKILEIRVEKMF